MSNASNLYAEKVFAEHPLALWPLDETVDYLSLISNEDRDISDSLKWTATNCLVSEDTSIASILSGTKLNAKLEIAPVAAMFSKYSMVSLTYAYAYTLSDPGAPT